jgi:hypothetical protein
MSEDPIMAALTRLETSVAKLEGSVATLEAGQTRLREQINTKLDDIRDKLSAVRQGTDTTQGHVLSQPARSVRGAWAPQARQVILSPSR